MARHTVLLADDNAAIVELLRLAFEADGHRVLSAADGEEALRVAHEERPDLLVLDLLMPRLDGLSVLARLKGDAATRSIRVLVVTGMPGGEGARLAEAYGAAAVLAKPLRIPDLLACARAHLLGAPVGG